MQTSSVKIRIWDLPTRLFHVAFALCVVGAIVTVKIGGAWMDWHVRFGITTLALLLFRIVWGIFGSRYARFCQFVTSPANTLRYLQQLRQIKHQTLRHAGHNPLGSWAVLALLLIIGFQAVTGLFSNDDVLTQGPFAQFVSQALSSQLTGWHQWNEPFVYGIIVLHLLAIAVYTFKGRKLITPMIDGDIPAAELAINTPSARDDLSLRLRAFLIALLLSCGAWWLMNLAASAL
jgi:cytochrome b